VSISAAATVGRIVDQFERLSAEEILTWTISTFGHRFAVVTALQAEGMVVLDLARRVDQQVRVITIDTGRLPPETHQMIETVRRHFSVQVEVLTPASEDVQRMVGEHGPDLFRRDPALRLLCCKVRKVDPLRRALTDLDAWATGLRRDSGAARARIAKIEIDEAHQRIVKLNPLADWTAEDVWAHIERHELPVHPLYHQGYTSIGCAPCTRATLPGEDERAGRWWWETDLRRECGIHVKLHETPELAVGEGAGRQGGEV
jgi:phosphoadenosine phosphosulfate reductase